MQQISGLPEGQFGTDIISLQVIQLLFCALI